MLFRHLLYLDEIMGIIMIILMLYGVRARLMELQRTWHNVTR